jgi:protein Tex
MSVDLEAIAQRGRCEISSLRLALPLLEQGYTPPFLARYRRDELGGLDEASLWALSSAVQTEKQIAERRQALQDAWQATALRDPALGHAIHKANSVRMLSRLSRLLKQESGDKPSDATRLAVRVLNPQKGDGADFAEVAAKVEGIENVDAAFEDLDAALVHRLASDPRIIGAAVRWLAKNARISIHKISDPHINAGDSDDDSDSDSDDQPKAEAKPEVAAPEESVSTESAPTEVVAKTDGTDGTDGNDGTSATDGTNATDGTHESPTSHESHLPATTPDPAEPAEPAPPQPAPKKKSPKTPKKPKKISPRQRRRRWLVGVLKPLQGKKFTSDKLSAFQIVMLGRALRSQVAECSFEYDAGKLVAELQRTAAGFNHHLEERMRDIVLQNEASIRDAAETAWWDDVQERASVRLVSITADHLRHQINRGPVDAKVVMSIDAVGPRTAATTIVSADGRVLHTEDLPCQLSATQRSQAVARMGELIHTHHIDLIVVSNGPARRATLIALGDLIAASPEKSIRWTLADRGGADAYAGSSVSDQEMRSTPRRFRAAAWLAFSVLQPAQSMAKVDPLKLRLSSFQRELSDEALSETLEDVMVSGASRGGVDANGAPVSWLRRLPGMTEQAAIAIDQARRTKLFASRDEIAEVANWSSAVESRQSLPFLRVFGSDETLDGTLIHPDDYPLAQKLAKSLELQLPPATPPGYVAPDYSQPSPSSDVKPIEVVTKSETRSVEDFTASGEKSPEFAIPDDAVGESNEAAAAETTTETTAETTTEPSGDAAAAEDTDSPVASDAAAEAPAAGEESSAGEGTVAGEATSDESAAEATASPEPASAESTSTASAASAATEPFRQPRPDRAKVDKCVKEWQIGTRRAHQIVNWLCDPFGDSDVSADPPAVLSALPSTKTLKAGDSVVGVVVGVMPFGVFVELAPDCSGLIHVSRVSDSYIEDLHEAVQIGDVVTAWVTGIDEKRRRVGLSAVSPQREAEMEEARRNRDARPARSGAGGPRRGGPAREGQPPRGGNRDAAPREGAAREGGNRGRSTGAPAGDSRGRQGAGAPSGGNRGGGGRDGNRSGGRPAGRQGGGGGGGRGREKKPESYRVVAKADAKPLTDAMQEGKEPLRSFGDLLQFFDKDKKTVKEPAESKPKAKQPAAEKVADSTPTVVDSDKPATAADSSDPSPSVRPAKPVDAPESTSESSAPQPATPQAEPSDS